MVFSYVNVAEWAPIARQDLLWPDKATCGAAPRNAELVAGEDRAGGRRGREPSAVPAQGLWGGKALRPILPPPPVPRDLTGAGLK